MNTLIVSSLITKSKSGKGEITVCEPKSLVEWKDFSKKRLKRSTKEVPSCDVQIPEFNDTNNKRHDLSLFSFLKCIRQKVGSVLN